MYKSNYFHLFLPFYLDNTYKILTKMNNFLFCTLLAYLLLFAAICANKTQIDETKNANISHADFEKGALISTEKSVFFTSGMNMSVDPEQKVILDDDNDEYYEYTEDDDDLNLITLEVIKVTDKPKDNEKSITQDNPNAPFAFFNASLLPEAYTELKLNQPEVNKKVRGIYSSVFQNIIQKLIETKAGNSFRLKNDVMAAFEKNTVSSEKDSSTTPDLLLIIGASVSGDFDVRQYLVSVDRIQGNDKNVFYKFVGLTPVTLGQLHKL